MGERDTLISTLPEDAREPAGRLYDQSPEPDPRDIVAELHRQGLLRDDQLRDAVFTLSGSLHSVRMRAHPPVSATPTILGPLGAGAMGEVMLAKDEGLNRIVAVKRLLPELGNRQAVVDRFYREAQVTAQLDHPAIVPIHSLVSGPGGALAYTMKLVRGRTLEAYLDEALAQLKASGREDLEHLLTTRIERFLQICDAVAYANERGVVHRDLKPENVMVGAFGEVLVMDWGIAKVLRQPELQLGTGEALQPSPGATRVGAVFGTPRYMSPEQALGANDKIDGRSDQYTLGLILQEVVTLQPAIPETLDVDGCLAWAGSARRRAMTHAHPKGLVPRELVAIVDQATSKDPARRYPSIGALAADVRRSLRDEAVSARPDTMGQRMHRWVGHHRTAVLSLVSFLMLLVVAVGGTLVLGGILVLEWRREVAEAHEQAVTEVLSLATAGSSKVHHQLDEIEQGLIGLSYAGEATLDRPAAMVEDFPKYEVGEPPPHMKQSPLYRRAVSVDRPSFSGPRTPDPDDPADVLGLQFQRLTAASFAITRPLIDSGSDESLSRGERFALIAKRGAPVRWAKIATKEGLVATIPGTEAYRSGVEGTKLPWYRQDITRELRWTPPHVDPDGMGLVLTATRPLLLHQELPLGTAAIDMTAQTLVDLLAPPPGAREAMLVDGKGQVVLWAGLDAVGAKSYAPKALAIPELAGPISARREGFYEAGGVIAAWSPVDLLDWRYVVLVDESALGQLQPAGSP